jgi:protein tyrosine phosphatase (PTP) superfamily phosphohydrolase (DUF442 family)
MMRAQTLILVALGCATLSGCAVQTAEPVDDVEGRRAAEVVAGPIMNFAKVSPGLYRGARPTDEGLAHLKKIGIRTIVDLEIGDLIEATPAQIDHEKQVATELGFVFVRRPMSAFQPFVSDAAMNETLAILADPAARPIYVHCKHGQDRTGLVIGLERVLSEGWDPADAHAEMLALGFHTFFWGLEHYYEEKTGFED